MKIATHAGHSHGVAGGWKYISMLTLTGGYMLVELIVGLSTGSLALVSDAFHMLSDTIALVVGLISVFLAKKSKTTIMTFGFKRAELIGGLINSIFVISAGLFIIVEAINKIIDGAPELNDPYLMLIVSGVGLGVNLIGIAVFSEHGVESWFHKHDHDHKHGECDHSHSHLELESQECIECSHSHDHVEATEILVIDPLVEETHKARRAAKNQKHAAARGVFLHILGDLLGSVAALGSGLIINYTSWEYRFYMDPILSLVICCIIFFTAGGLLKDCTKVMMQSAPYGLPSDLVSSKLLECEHVKQVHDLHIWTFTSDCVVCTAHIVASSSEDRDTAMYEVKSLLHDIGIHSSVIQMEHIDKLGNSACYCPGPVCNHYDNLCCNESVPSDFEK